MRWRPRVSPAMNRLAGERVYRTGARGVCVRPAKAGRRGAPAARKPPLAALFRGLFPLLAARLLALVLALVLRRLRGRGLLGGLVRGLLRGLGLGLRRGLGHARGRALGVLDRMLRAREREALLEVGLLRRSLGLLERQLGLGLALAELAVALLVLEALELLE
ncbi:MAG: hypothetical protein ACK55I_49575, partial [bacterium]